MIPILGRPCNHLRYDSEVLAWLQTRFIEGIIMIQSFSPQASANIMGGIGKLLLAIALAAGAYYTVTFTTADFREATQKQLEKQHEEEQAAKKSKDAASLDNQQIPGTVKNFEKATDAMKESGDLLINWAIVLFGGTIGIAILGKSAKILDKNWGLVLVPPIWVLLGASLFHGSQFKGMLTFQLAQGKYSLPELNLELFLQQTFFKYSLFALGLFALWYLFFRFSMLEQQAGEPGDGD